MVTANTHPEFNRHAFNVIYRGQFMAYADSKKAAKWADREIRKQAIRIALAKLIRTIEELSR